MNEELYKAVIQTLNDLEHHFKSLNTLLDTLSHTVIRNVRKLDELERRIKELEDRDD